MAYVPGTSRLVVVAVGTSGSDVSGDGGQTWAQLGTVAFNSVAFAESAVPDQPAAGWAVGPSGRIARWIGPAPGARVPSPGVRVRKEPP